LIPYQSASLHCCSTWARILNANLITWCSLLSWATLIFARSARHDRSGVVGLMSIGEEEAKGNDLTKEGLSAAARDDEFEFQWETSRRDVFPARFDVIVY